MFYPVVIALLLASGVVSANQPVEFVGAQPEVGDQSTVGVVGPQSHGVESYAPNEQVGGQHYHGPAHFQQQQQQQPPSYYAPAGVITVVGEQQQQQPAGPNQKQVGSSGVSRYSSGSVVGGVSSGQVGPTSEQYGQPESASMPANYKPWGSWGLYIGGNPADGYYSNYYKSMNMNNDKQQVGEPQYKPTGPAAAMSSVVKQAGSSPFAGGEYYPFAYSTSDFNNASPQQVGAQVMSQPQPQMQMQMQQQQANQQVGFTSPVHAGAQIYGTPNSFETNSLAYADSYATKKMGATKEAASSTFQQQQQQQQQHQAEQKSAPARKQYQPRFGYMQMPQSQYVAAGNQQQQHAPAGQPQVVAYPVPVGSQMVGSQQGVDGAFQPYGVHAFTRYAVKPALVNSPAEQQGYYYQYPANSASPPSYKYQPQPQQHQQYQQQQQQQQYYGPNQPLGYYGYPMSQLHYSHNSMAQMMPTVGGVSPSQYYGGQVGSSGSASASSSSHVGSSSVGVAASPAKEQNVPTSAQQSPAAAAEVSSEKAESGVEKTQTDKQVQ